MKLYSFEFDKEVVVQIFINHEESQNSEILRKIDILKNLYSNVSIFISGNSDTISTFKGLLEYWIHNE